MQFKKKIEIVTKPFSDKGLNCRTNCRLIQGRADFEGRGRLGAALAKAFWIIKTSITEH